MEIYIFLKKVINRQNKNKAEIPKLISSRVQFKITLPQTIKTVI